MDVAHGAGRRRTVALLDTGLMVVRAGIGMRQR